MAHGSRRAVIAAIVGNSAVTVAKTGAFLASGSAAMLSEALHSVADTMNQVLLLIGIQRSVRLADASHPFGYGAERSVWALMSAVGIFFLGCGVTVVHGVHSLMHPAEVGGLGWALGVLTISFAIEGSVLWIALRSQWRAANGRPFLRFLRTQADPSAVAVVLEDSAACLGVLIAVGGLLMTHLTGNPAWDASASISIGLLLGLIAIWLVGRNKHLLVGPAIPASERARIREVLASFPTVEKVAMLRTRVMDSETWRVAAEVEFSGDALAERLEPSLQEAWPQIQTWEDFRAFAAKYADEVVELLGDEIDRLEDAIREVAPSARYLDIEAD